jgi:hypothetical protein
VDTRRLRRRRYRASELYTMPPVCNALALSETPRPPLAGAESLACRMARMSESVHRHALCFPLRSRDGPGCSSTTSNLSRHASGRNRDICLRPSLQVREGHWHADLNSESSRALQVLDCLQVQVRAAAPLRPHPIFTHGRLSMTSRRLGVSPSLPS